MIDKCNTLCYYISAIRISHIERRIALECKLYDITNNDIIGGKLISIESNAISMYVNAYRIARKAYNRNRAMDLVINGGVSVVLSSVPNVGIVVWAHGKAVWVKEVE